MLFVTSGLGGMSGAQPKAGNIAGVVSITAEINPLAAQKRYDQGWVDELHTSLDELIPAALKAVEEKRTVSMAYVGNVVDLWERLAAEDVHVDLGSDQTSLHNPWAGGYYPVGLSLEESKRMMAEEPALFKEKVQESLRRQVAAINKLTAKGMYFFDYGNAFLLESSRAGADIMKTDGKFRYPSYVQDIMGPMFFDYGFGPFRWVCSSGDPKDLETSDRIATEVLEEIRKTATPDIIGQLDDNIHWIKEAGKNHLVVGSQARILLCCRKDAPRLPWLSMKQYVGEKSLDLSFWDVITMMCREQTLLSVRHLIYMTAHSSVLTWLYRMLLATLSVVQHGYLSTMEAVLVGEKLSMVASVW